MDSREAFVEMIRLHGDKIYNFAFRLSGNADDARDLVQEAFTRAFKHWDKYDASRPFESWVFKIMQNIYLDTVRRKENQGKVSLDAPIPGGSVNWDALLPGMDRNPVENVLRQEMDSHLQQALDSLPIHYRSAIALADIEGLSYEQIAQVMACPLGTVRSRVHQGRVLLRRAFEMFEDKGGLREA